MAEKGVNAHLQQQWTGLHDNEAGRTRMGMSPEYTLSAYTCDKKAPPNHLQESDTHLASGR